MRMKKSELDASPPKSKSWVERLYEFVTNPRTVRVSTYLILGLYIGLVIIGVIIATALDPDGYNVFDNWISDLGSSNHTPAPILYDLACISAGILTIPFHYYLERYLAPLPKTPNDFEKNRVPGHRWSFRLMGAGFFFSFIGSIFYIGVGIWSGDRSELNGIPMHEICSIGAFLGFAFAAIFVGLTLTISDRRIVPSPFNYILGTYGVYVPITVAILNITGFPGATGPLLEWSLLWAILGWIVPLSFFVLRHTHKVEHGEL